MQPEDPAMLTLTALRQRLAVRAARAREVDLLLAELDTPSRLDRLDFRRMHPPLTRPDGAVWEPTPEETDRLEAAMFGSVRRSITERLAAVRRHGKGGLC